ncbi:deoxyribodipyrimidine photolyase [Antarcticibacterium sp. W02-3]|uniref:cryptochrome/photolyase family protein n=1 Tax=Antarcticibacterium sp. W02-3 TaxID=2183747 RepID=UPI0020443D77|nr:deoxyribodipyrimidine photo-lyase [Antarcticibacterium sp. W02-3]MCM4159025.1 deoxyribodipyrimidine photolyase [Antarcticibacterium sp. W02-3]
MSDKVSIFWFRRDLRIDDNVGFLEALKGTQQVLPIFIFDTEILGKLKKDDSRVSFIHDQIQKIRKELQQKGSSLAVYHGKPLEIFKDLAKKYNILKVYTNRDYEPYSRQRDEEIKDFLSTENISFKTFKDQVIFEQDEIVKKDGDPYVVYTPYMKLWKEKFKETDLKVHYTSSHLDNLVQNTRLPNLSLGDIGFERSNLEIPDYDVSPTLIADYEKKRNFPAKDATSRLGVHLRFGTVGLRKIIKKANTEENKTFLEELIWREFFMQILYHFPNTVTEAFKPKYDRIDWRNNEGEFEKWKEGKTGYPLVDAGMRQLNTIGFMHNRVRMLTASFLCKHLLIDWRWGEAYFAEKLLDYEMASNVGNWQWAAGSGVDAAPYFRIFNPTTQIEKFDKERKYIKEWIGEIDTNEYPGEMVDHKEARERALSTYKSALNG